MLAAALLLVAVFRPAPARRAVEHGPAAHAPRTPEPTPTTADAGPDGPDGPDGPAQGADALPLELVPGVLATARGALGVAGLQDGAAPSWALDLVPGRVRRVAPGAAVVEVAATVIVHDGDGWRGPVVRHVAVPLLLGPPLRLAGPAWPVPSDTVVASAAAGPPVPEELAVAATDALVAAGWEVTAAAAVTEQLPGVLRVVLDGTAPDGTAAVGLAVWVVRGEDDVLRPAGAAGTTATDATTSTTDPTHPTQELP